LIISHLRNVLFWSIKDMSFLLFHTADDHRIVSLKNDVDVVNFVVNDKNVVNVVKCRKVS
jgi:hypothetical protein